MLPIVEVLKHVASFLTIRATCRTINNSGAVSCEREEWVQVGDQSHNLQENGFLRASCVLNIYARIPQVM